MVTHPNSLVLGFPFFTGGPPGHDFTIEGLPANHVKAVTVLNARIVSVRRHPQNTPTRMRRPIPIKIYDDQGVNFKAGVIYDNGTQWLRSRQNRTFPVVIKCNDDDHDLMLKIYVPTTMHLEIELELRLDMNEIRS